MNEFVSWCRHLLVSFLFHALTSLHPPSFYRNDFSTCSYLKPELKQLCVNLSHFPGKFKRESAVAIFDFNGNMLDMLVQRSLLQYERSLKQFYFHQMLKTFFSQMNVGENAEKLQYYFSSQYQLYYAQLLQRAIPDDGTKLELQKLRYELHNIVHMFMLFISHKHVNYTFKIVSHPLRLKLRSHYNQH